MATKEYREQIDEMRYQEGLEHRRQTRALLGSIADSLKKFVDGDDQPMVENEELRTLGILLAGNRGCPPGEECPHWFAVPEKSTRCGNCWYIFLSHWFAAPKEEGSTDERQPV